MRERERDFHLESPRRHRGGWLEVMNRVQTGSGSFDVVSYFGAELAADVVAVLRSSFAARQDLIQQMRHAKWVMRNTTITPSVSAAREKLIVDSAMFICSGVQFMRMAGAEEEDLLALVGCLGHGCTCDGCDLADGSRFRELGGTGASSAP